MTLLVDKFKEVLLSVFPIVILVLLAKVLFVPISIDAMLRFLLGAIIIVIGLAFFLAGVEIGVAPIGHFLGEKLIRSGKLVILLASSIALAFFISVAEPDLRILASQVDLVSGGAIPKFLLVIVVSLGFATLMSVGMIRIIRNIPVYIIMLVIYGVILILSFFVSPEFLSVAFDASGATTGALSVPVILAISIGASKLKKNTKASEKDSFGLVGIISTGPILAVLMLGLLLRPNFSVAGPDEIIQTSNDSIVGPFLSSFRTSLIETGVSLLPIVIFFLFFALRKGAMMKRDINRALKGLGYAFIGLSLFLCGVHTGFLDVGRLIGLHAGQIPNRAPIIVTAFVLGLITVLAEPAVHVLTADIERVTGGYVKKKAVMVSLSLGVALAITFSVLRIIIPALQLWHFLLPGYVIALALTFISPKIFVGMAFDAGGVASGPMTATFILAFTSGAASAVEGANALSDGFGMIAMVAMMPIITIQILGTLFKIKSRKNKGVST